MLYTLGGSSLVVAACQPTPETTPAASEVRFGPKVAELLAGRAAALRAGDEQAWLADVDPSNVLLLNHERMLFANLRRFPFATFELEPLVSGLTPRPVRFATSLPMSCMAYRVGLRMRLQDVDSGDNAAHHLCVFGLLDGAVKLVDVAAPPPDGSDAALPFLLEYPWDSTELTVRRAGDVILAADASVPDLDDYTEAALRASAAVRADWGDNPAPAGFLLFLTARKENRERWFGGVPAAAEAVGIPVPGLTATPAGDVLEVEERHVGARVVVNLVAAGPGTSRYGLLKYAIAQAVSMSVVPVAHDPADLTNGFGRTLGAPRWAVEGFARYLQARTSAAMRAVLRARLRAGLHRDLFTGDLPDNAAFYAPESGAFNHCLAWSVFDYVSDRYGHTRTVRLYVAIVGRRDPAGSPGVPALVDALIHTGLVTEQVSSATDSAFYQQWLRHLQRS
ncbi:MAG TPA: hypothetical protein VGD43_00015 [Micromonospora sp.]